MPPAASPPLVLSTIALFVQLLTVPSARTRPMIPPTASSPWTEPLTVTSETVPPARIPATAPTESDSVLLMAASSFTFLTVPVTTPNKLFFTLEMVFPLPLKVPAYESPVKDAPLRVPLPAGVQSSGKAMSAVKMTSSSFSRALYSSSAVFTSTAYSASLSYWSLKLSFSTVS